MREYMQAFFDSPETIRNKSKEFKSSTFSGFNKQDVMNYLSLIAEQQSIMIGLLREHNIPLYVDDGYTKEEQFSKPIVENQEFISQYMSDNSSETLGEMQAELDKLKMENDQLKSSIENGEVEPATPSFDSAFGLDSNSDNSAEIEELKMTIEEQKLQIQTLEEELISASGESNSDSFGFNNDSLSTDNSEFEAKQEAYEREIEELKIQLNEAEEKLHDIDSNTESNFDVFGDENGDGVLDDEELQSLRIQIESLNEELTNLRTENEVLKENAENVSSLSNEEAPNDFNSFDNSSIDNDELDSLKNQVESLLEQVSKFKDENEDLRQNLEVQQVALIAAEEKVEAQNIVSQSNTENTFGDNTSFDNEELDSLRVTVEQLEKNILKVEREKQNLELRLEEINSELNEYKTPISKDPVVVMDPETLAIKHRELLEKENNILMEKNTVEAKLQEINNKLSLISEKEALIETNKELLSEDYVNSVKKKESEIERLRKQMDKMLLVAQTTADETEKEAEEKASQLVSESKSTANTIIDEAVTKKTRLEEEANKILSLAQENKTKTDEELKQFRLETRSQAEKLIMEAQSKANSVIENATVEAEDTKKKAEVEADRIMSDVESRLSEKEQTILDKQSEIEKLHKYFLKSKTECIVDIKKILNKLETIVYEEDDITQA